MGIIPAPKEVPVTVAHQTAVCSQLPRPLNAPPLLKHTRTQAKSLSDTTPASGTKYTTGLDHGARGGKKFFYLLWKSVP